MRRILLAIISLLPLLSYGQSMKIAPKQIEPGDNDGKVIITRNGVNVLDSIKWLDVSGKPGDLERTSNKVNNLNNPNNTTYPTTQAVMSNFVSLNPNSDNSQSANYSGDLNDLIGINQFNFKGNNTINKPPFFPYGGVLYNHAVTTNLGTQMALGWSASSGDDYFGYRTKNGGNWSDWYRVASQDWVNSQGFLTSETDPVYTADKPNIIFSGDNNSLLNNDAGYIISETDPTVPIYVKNITTGDISNWNSKADIDDISGGVVVPDGDISGLSDNKSIVWHSLYNENDYSTFIELGQSNMEGRSGDETNPDYPFNSLIGALSWDVASGSTITLNTLRGGAISGSHANYFADKLFQLTGKKAIMIEAASGGSGLADNSGATTGNHWGANGNLRAEALSQYNNYISYTGVNRLSGILWCQGERDAQQMDSNPSYTVAMATQNMRDVIEWMQSSWPGVPIYISELGNPATGGTQGWQDMRDIQHLMTQEYDNVFIAFDGAKNFPAEGKMSDNLHYNYIGYKDMGEGLAEYVANQEGVYVWDGSKWDIIGNNEWSNIKNKPDYIADNGIKNAVSTSKDVNNVDAIIYSGDLNNVINNSFIYASFSATNIPPNSINGGFLETRVTNAGAGAVVQTFWENEPKGNIFKRNKSFAGWSSWDRIPFEGESPTLIKNTKIFPTALDATDDLDSVSTTGMLWVQSDAVNNPDVEGQLLISGYKDSQTGVEFLLSGSSDDNFKFRRKYNGIPQPYYRVASREWVNTVLPTVNNGTLTINTSGIATGSTTFSANQSNNSSVIVNVPGTNLGGNFNATTGALNVTSSTGNNATLTLPALQSGDYAPSVYNLSGFSTVSPNTVGGYDFIYSQVGNVVTVSGSFEYTTDGSGSGYTTRTFDFDPPIPVTTMRAWGTGSYSVKTNGASAAVIGASNMLRITLNDDNNTTHKVYFTCQYILD